MRVLVTGSQMKELDRYTIEEIGIESMVLMERAALEVSKEVQGLVGRNDKIWSVCGSGNNGADGIAAARILYLKGYDVTIWLASEKKGTEEHCRQLAAAKKLGVPVKTISHGIHGDCDLIIDAIFGVGLTRNIEGEYKEWMQILLERYSHALMVSVDLPSGIHSDTGQVMGIGLRADVTVTFGYEKLGTVLYPGKACAGRVAVCDIGFPDIRNTPVSYEACTFEPEDMGMIPNRKEYSNKGTYKKVLIVAGSVHMSGAAYLSAKAAYRTGAGLVKILTAEENREILLQQLPEAIIETYSSQEAVPGNAEFLHFMERQCQWAGVIVVGPGIGRGEAAQSLVEGILTCSSCPVILDADALNVIADRPKLKESYQKQMILTPHLGEMARLTGKTIEEIQSSLLQTAREYSQRYGITCVLKDAVTVAAAKNHPVFLNTSGSSAMAKAGSGDVLTGVIAGLLALGLTPEKAAFMGVYLHGRAGLMAGEQTGIHSLLAGEITEYIGAAMNIKASQLIKSTDLK